MQPQALPGDREAALSISGEEAFLRRGRQVNGNATRHVTLRVHATAHIMRTLLTANGLHLRAE